MIRLRQLLEHEVVDDINLLGEFVTLTEALRHQLDLDDALEVRLHHGDGSEERGKVIGQLGTAGITGVHRDEETGTLLDLNSELAKVRGLLTLA